MLLYQFHRSLAERVEDLLGLFDLAHDTLDQRTIGVRKEWPKAMRRRVGHSSLYPFLRSRARRLVPRLGQRLEKVAKHCIVEANLDRVGEAVAGDGILPPSS